MANDDFAGLTALVTGGASGIGLATARLLAARGARVAVLDRERPGDDDRLHAVVADVTDDAGVRSAVASAAELLGGDGLDILVNNAGIGAAGTVEDNDDSEWQRVFDVNVFGIVRVSRAAMPLLRRAVTAHGQAAIVNTCSVAGLAGLPQRALYGASKGAVYALTLAMAADHIRERVRVNCVTPGTADTPWVGRLLAAASDPEAERSALEARQPTGRLVTADEVAAAIAYLASPSAGATTGVALPVDGGMASLRLRPRLTGQTLPRPHESNIMIGCIGSVSTPASVVPPVDARQTSDLFFLTRDTSDSVIRRSRAPGGGARRLPTRRTE